ncbi:High affinity immunoglobulin epsilon receptor subunit beta, partial [Sciurus carolinensis]|nr:High affinity immunoglobulin epsilon receptor subunit beta [Sciurus carolinensis]
APEIEVLEASPGDSPQQGTSATSPPQQTWLTFLKRELEFLGVTQILIGAICLCFGTIVFSVLDISDFDEEVFSSFKAGYPFWGAVLVRGRLGANAVSSVAAGAGIIILILNLSNSWAYISQCEKIREDDSCFVASFTTEIVAMMLFLTILGFGSAMSLTIYGIGEEFKGDKV